LGGTVEEAGGVLESFGFKLRTLPGFENWVRGLGVATRDANGNLRETAQIIPELVQKIAAAHNPALANQFREFIGGISDQGWRTLNNPDFFKQFQTAMKSEAGAGITDEAAKQATAFEQSWREVWMRIGNMAEGGESKLFDTLTVPMQKFSDWLDKNSPQINDAISRIATSVGALTDAWVDDVSRVKWDDVSKWFEDTSNSAAHLVQNLADLAKSIATNLPVIESLVGALIGARTGAMFGPMGAAVGAGVGAFAPHAIEQELNPNAPHAADTRGFWRGIGGWWGSHAPGWLGGGGASDAKAITQNGVPVSDSNPLAVNVVKVADDAASGGGFWGAVSGAMGSLGHALGFGRGAPPGIRARAEGGAPRPYNYEGSGGSGNLTALINEVSKKYGIDPRIMEGIRAGESGHGRNYDRNVSAIEESYGPFQLNRRPGAMGWLFERDTAAERKRLGLGDLTDPRTIPCRPSG
jgi:hypothetical protein